MKLMKKSEIEREKERVEEMKERMMEKKRMRRKIGIFEEDEEERES